MTSFLSSLSKRKKSPDQLIASAKAATKSIISDTWEIEEDKALAESTLESSLVDIKQILYGDLEKPEVDENKVRDVSTFIQQEGFLALLIDNIQLISFESRKDAALIFNNLLRKDVQNFVGYLSENLSLVNRLVDGYNHADAALSCGSMLRECIRHEVLARHILFSELVWQFFDTYVHLPNFDVASDAFNTLKDLLTTPKQKNVAVEFLETNYAKFNEKYEILLQSENYVTRRRSLKLLSELLLDRSNYNVMMRYISSKQNLKIVMNLLRHKSSNIQFETFHVFKIFVANPNKTPEIASVLSMNKVKLLAYLETFHSDRDDPQFHDEKRLLIETLGQMTEPPKSSTPSSASTASAPASAPTTSSAVPAADK